MSEFIVGARGHDFGRRSVEELLSSIGDAGFCCTQLAYTKAVEGVKSYADVTPELVAATNAAVQKSGVSIAVDGTYVELSYADEDKRRAEVAKALSQVPVAKALRAGCMGSETTNMAKQPTVSRREAQEALLRSLGEILPVCEEQGVLFAVECVYYHAMNTPEAVKMVLDTIASPNLRVICDLANYVGPENASVDAQRRLWDKVGSWYSDKIVAVHFKGQNFKPDGTLYSTSLEDSCVDYKGGFEMLRALPISAAALLFFRTKALPITIEDNVWIGGGTIVLPGITIGRNSVIGAGSVVTKSIPTYSVAVGNPCRVIRELPKEDL